MPKPPKYALFKSKKERIQHLQEAWRVQREIMLNEDVSPGVRLDASEKRLDRLIGKAAQRIEANVEVTYSRQAVESIRSTPEGRELAMKVSQMIVEKLLLEKPAMDVTNTEDDG
jgi:hypothetical protein